MDSLMNSCKLLPILANHSPPLVPGRYSEAQIRDARSKTDVFYKELKIDPRLIMRPEVVEAANILGNFSITCAYCPTKEFSYCSVNCNGPSHLYTPVIYSSVSSSLRKQSSGVFAAGKAKSGDDFTRLTRENLEANIDNCVKSAMRKLDSLGVYDNGDSKEHQAKAAEYSRAFHRKHPYLSHIIDAAISWIPIPPGRQKLEEHVRADVRALSEELLSDDDLRMMYRGLTGDIFLEFCEPYFSRIEAWLPSVRSFMEHTRRKKQ